MRDFFRVVPKKRTVHFKHKKAVLFRNPGSLQHFLFYIGSSFILIGVIYFLYLFEPLARAIFVYEFYKIEPIAVKIDRKPTATVAPIVSIAPTVVLLPTPTEARLPTPTQTQVLVPTETITSPTPTLTPTLIPTPTEIPDPRIFISIPKIHAEAEVQPKVSTQSKEEYTQVLKSGMIAHASESALPGSGDGTSSYLFAHSTEQDLGIVRKNSVFYLLDTMVSDDSIYIKQNGQTLEYKVYNKKILPASDTSNYKFSDPENEVLILQTCWPLGTNWKRLLVFAKRV